MLFQQLQCARDGVGLMCSCIGDVGGYETWPCIRDCGIVNVDSLIDIRNL